jgi:lysophospholipase L1-like esterase
VLVQDLKAYSDAAKRVGMEENVTVIDLNAISVKMLEGMTQAQADEFDATGHTDERAENGKNRVDRTHLNEKGQMLFGRIVADTLIRTQVELGGDVIGEAVQARPVGAQ